MVACGLATMAGGISTDFGQLFWTRALVGVGEALCLPSALALISDYFPRRHRTKAIAIVAVGMFVGSGLGLTGGAALIHYVGWRTVLLLAGAPAIPLGLVAFYLREPVKGAMDEPDAAPQGPPPSFWTLFHIRTYWIAVVAVALLTAATGALLHWLLKFEEMRDTAERHSTVIASAITLGGCLLGAAASGVAGDSLLRRTRRGLVLTIALGLIVGGPAIFVYLVSDVRWIYLPSLGVAGFFLSWSAAPMGALIHSLVEARLRASALALFTFAIHLLGDAPSPVVVGAISDRYAAKAVNRLGNPSFDAATPPGQTPPAGWRVLPPEARDAVALDNRVKRTGERSLCVRLPAGLTKTVTIEQQTPRGAVNPGQVFAASLLCKAQLPPPAHVARPPSGGKPQAPGGGISISVTFTDDGGEAVHSVQAELDFSQIETVEWDRLEVQAAAPVEAQQAVVAITATGEGTVWVDDVSFAEAPLRRALFLLPALTFLGGLVALLALRTVEGDMEAMQRRVAERRRLASGKGDE
jgi:predicted MFS family arabinose efflux permease